MTDKDSIIVLSGGLDSVTLLHAARERIALAVTFDYGSNHNAREMATAQWQCQQLGIAHKVINLGFMPEVLHSSLLEGAEAIPEGEYDDQNMRSTVVPFRNGIMLSVAAAMAEDRRLLHVMIANHAGDHAIYPDCRPAFVASMSRAITAGTYTHTDIVAPFTHMTKAEIVALGHQLGVDYSHTYSCYKGGEHHCGRCGTCRERREAFENAGVDDPTIYDL